MTDTAGTPQHDGMTAPRSRRVERWVPGVRVVRTYERRWLRADLVAGVVLAAVQELGPLPGTGGEAPDVRDDRPAR